MKKVLVTGASGFIGRAICRSLSAEYEIIALDSNMSSSDEASDYVTERGDISDIKAIKSICATYIPDVVIHCAGIAHQKISSSLSADLYKEINSAATEHLASIAAEVNPDVFFIFLSSISVYGEENTKGIVDEKEITSPSSDYAFSKFEAEKRLEKLFKSGSVTKIDILRLAPVYDAEWSLNLDRRVFGPKKIAYIMFGSGEQKMSAVARNNLIDFIGYRLKQTEKKSSDGSFCNIFNICDETPYSFKDIIGVFKQSKHHPDRFVARLPLSIVWISTRLAGLMIKNKRQWLHSCYDKLAQSLVFDNKRMLGTGFKPKYNLESIFLGKE